MNSIYIIGAGNVATQLGIGLQEAGIQFVGVFSKTFESAQILGEKLKCPYTNEINSISQEADIYIVSVKDDALYEDLGIIIPANAIIAHTSGSVQDDVLSKYSQNFGVLYPLCTFTKEKKVDWKDIPVCIEGSNEKVRETLKVLGLKLSSHIHEFSSQQRAVLHLAAVWVNNFPNHMLHIAEELCKEENIPFPILEPLAIETIRKAFSQGAFSSQTGPALRSDRKTLEKHLRLLGDDEDKSTLYIYMSKAIRGAHK